MARLAVSLCSNEYRCSRSSSTTTPTSSGPRRSNGSASSLARWSGKRVLHINATAYGGGVAELLATHVPLLRSLGIDAEWQVMHGSDEFFAVTKQVHNGLQGADIEWNAAMQRTYLEKVLDNSLLLDENFDYVVVHDPQPAALLNFLRDDPNLSANGTKWIWRCHIDLTAANPKRVGVLPAVRRAAPRVGVDDAAVRTGVAEHGAASCTRRRASTRCP